MPIVAVVGALLPNATQGKAVLVTLGRAEPKASASAKLAHRAAIAENGALVAERPNLPPKPATEKTTIATAKSTKAIPAEAARVVTAVVRGHPDVKAERSFAAPQAAVGPRSATGSTMIATDRSTTASVVPATQALPTPTGSDAAKAVHKTVLSENGALAPTRSCLQPPKAATTRSTTIATAKSTMVAEPPPHATTERPAPVIQALPKPETSARARSEHKPVSLPNGEPAKVKSCPNKRSATTKWTTIATEKSMTTAPHHSPVTALTTTKTDMASVQVARDSKIATTTTKTLTPVLPRSAGTAKMTIAEMETHNAENSMSAKKVAVNPKTALPTSV
jgi:hypothetical protein